MLSYRQLEHFVTVAQELHFSRAADKLGVAQSAVSVQVQQLEQQLGVRLLQRNKRKPITLTDAGELLYEEAVIVLRHMERAQQIGQLAAQGMSGHVKLGYISSAVTSGMLAQVLTRFRPGHEQVHMQVMAMATPRQLQALQLGEIDAGLLRPRQRAVEQGATGVGVDFDELGAALATLAGVAEVKVETHEHPLRPGIEAGNGGGARERFGLVGGQGDDGLDRGHDVGHRLQGLGCHEDRGRREQMRTAVRDVGREPEQGGFGLELLAQACGVEAAAVAAAVQRACNVRGAGERGEGVIVLFHARAHPAPVGYFPGTYWVASKRR